MVEDATFDERLALDDFGIKLFPDLELMPKQVAHLLFEVVSGIRSDEMASASMVPRKMEIELHRRFQMVHASRLISVEEINFTDRSAIYKQLFLVLDNFDPGKREEPKMNE